MQKAREPATIHHMHNVEGTWHRAHQILTFLLLLYTEWCELKGLIKQVSLDADMCYDNIQIMHDTLAQLFAICIELWAMHTELSTFPSSTSST